MPLELMFWFPALTVNDLCSSKILHVRCDYRKCPSGCAKKERRADESRSYKSTRIGKLEKIQKTTEARDKPEMKRREK
jgi:hypothetical protein